MREQILTFLEKNSRIDPKELAVLLGSDEVTIMNEIAKMEEEKVICGYHTLIDWEKVSDESNRSDRSACHSDAWTGI